MALSVTVMRMMCPQTLTACLVRHKTLRTSTWTKCVRTYLGRNASVICLMTYLQHLHLWSLGPISCARFVHGSMVRALHRAHRNGAPARGPSVEALQRHCVVFVSAGRSWGMRKCSRKPPPHRGNLWGQRTTTTCGCSSRWLRSKLIVPMLISPDDLCIPVHPYDW